MLSKACRNVTLRCALLCDAGATAAETLTCPVLITNLVSIRGFALGLKRDACAAAGRGKTTSRRFFAAYDLWHGLASTAIA